MAHSIYIDPRNFWTCAADYSADKCAVYPEHAGVQEFSLAAGLDVLEYGCGGGADAMSYLRAGAKTVTLADIVSSNLDASKKRIATILGGEPLSRARFWLLRVTNRSAK